MTSPVKLPPLPSAVDTVRALFRGQPDYFTAQDSYYTQDQMRAYAEQAVREALAAQAPVGGDLPHWEEISAKLGRDEVLTPLELFIHENEPAGDADAWRDQLEAALASASSKECRNGEPS